MPKSDRRPTVITAVLSALALASCDLGPPTNADDGAVADAPTETSPSPRPEPTPDDPAESPEDADRATPPTPPAEDTPEHGGAEPEQPDPDAIAEEPEDDPAGSHADGEVTDAVDGYGVSAGHPAAVDAGMAVMADGGNAVDAAIAAAFAVSVVEPFASGIGGGGATLVHELGEDPVSYDYREVVAGDGTIPDSGTGVPGFPAGMSELHREHGDAEFGDLLDPAIELAEQGVPTSPFLAAQLASGQGSLPAADLPHLYPGGAPLEAGDPIVQPALADTLRTLADEGADAFYEGSITEQLTAVDGLDAETLAGYEVVTSTPPSGHVADFEVIGAAPPLPGATFIQLLQIAEAMGVADQSADSADFIHTLSAAWEASAHHLERDIGDPAFVDVPVGELTDPARNAERAAELPRDGVTSLSEARPRQELAANTTHLTVVDDDGTMVSMTNTLTNFWGAGTYVDGFFLNDQLSRFDIGATDANEPAPGKRSVTYTMPTIIADEEGRPVLGIGSPGGRRIANVLAQVFTRWGLQDAGLADAVAAPRFHAEGSSIEFEQQPSGQVAEELSARGYASLQEPPTPYYFGSVQALEVDYEAGEIRGATDERREADHRIEVTP